MRKRRRAVTGVVPTLWRLTGRALRWLLEHPQPAIMLGVVACGLAVGWWAVSRSESFRVERVVFAPPDVTFDVPSAVIGRRLWDVDVDALARQLKAQRPSLKRVRVIRLAPNTLQVDSVIRVPAAQVRAGQWHPVDAEGYVMPDSQPTPYDQLVVFTGLDSPQAPLKSGRQHAGEAMSRALRLLQRLRRAPQLAGHRLVSLDVSDAEQLNLVIDDDVQVRCGSEEQLAAQLDRLELVLKRVASHAFAIRYIDVRFQDPVIAPRT